MRARWRNFELPTRVILDKSTATPTYGSFTAEPFSSGFGHTIGNSLRRILLGHIEGAAPYYCKIKGVAHQFSTIPGIVEDVVEICLNLKQLVVKLQEGIDQRKLILEFHDKGEIKASHFMADAAVEIINPDLHIATATEEVDFMLEVGIKKSRGYVSAEENYASLEEPELDIIPLDSVFSPVVKVSYDVRQTRLGTKTNYDSLIINITTKGNISPEEALIEAAKILRKHLIPFTHYYELNKEVVLTEKIESEVRIRKKLIEEFKSKLIKPIFELDLSVRATHCMKAAKIKTVGELVTRTEQDLLKIKNFGKTTLREVKKKLEELGLTLGMDTEQILKDMEEQPISSLTGPQPFYLRPVKAQPVEQEETREESIEVG